MIILFIFLSLISCFLASIARRSKYLSKAILHRRGVFYEEKRCWNFFSSVSTSCEIHWCFVLIEVPSSRTQTCPESQTCFVVVIVIVMPYIVLPCFLPTCSFIVVHPLGFLVEQRSSLLPCSGNGFTANLLVGVTPSACSHTFQK